MLGFRLGLLRVAIVMLFLQVCSACGDEQCPGPSRGLTESCCLTHGIDACGSGLFCAAFDGRSIPVCYAERTRDDLTMCTEDRQCRSGSCNSGVNLCRTLSIDPQSACTAGVGCVDSLGDLLPCLNVGFGYECTYTDGNLHDPCNTDADCNIDFCDLATMQCSYEIEGACASNADCAYDGLVCKYFPTRGNMLCADETEMMPNSTDPECVALACDWSVPLKCTSFCIPDTEECLYDCCNLYGCEGDAG